MFLQRYWPTGLIVLLLVVWMSYPVMQAKSAIRMTNIDLAYIRRVHNFEMERLGITHPAGIVFSPGENVFYVGVSPTAAQAAAPDTTLFRLTPTGILSGTLHIAAPVDNPLNLTFDGKRNRLLIFNLAENQLLEVATDVNGALNPNTLKHYNVQSFGLQNPQGMTVDPASGYLFILDATGPRLLRVEPGADGSFDNALTTSIDLQTVGMVNPHGLAWDSSSNHLHILSTGEQRLYELSLNGQVVTTRNMASFDLSNPQALLFAPSGDLTDDQTEMSLYVADAGQVAQAVTDRAAVTKTQSVGDVVELTFIAPTVPAESSFTATLVRTTDTATLTPPSPDPSGLTYLPNHQTLLMADGEVEETVNGITHFQGANVWELTLGGSVVHTANIAKVPPTVTPMTNEPTGVAWNPANGHFYFSDDDTLRIYDLNPGKDGLVGTADDTWTFFSTAAVGDNDPEGITYDSVHNRLFVADETNMEIYQYALNGTLVGHFDVERYGILGPDSVEFNPERGTLFTLSGYDSSIIIETTTDGILLRTFDISAAHAIIPSGLAYAPASDGSGAYHFYIVDRGIDNNDNPQIIDGKLFELTAPPPISERNTPPVVDAGPAQTIVLPDCAVLAGTVTDDGVANPPGAVTSRWSMVRGTSTVSFADTNAPQTTACFKIAGTYVLRLSATDGELSPLDEVTIHVTGEGSVAFQDLWVTASSDDAEESNTGSVNLTSPDLDMFIDSGSLPAVTNQAIGLRFDGVVVPPGATIVDAFVQFQVDEIASEATQITIHSQAADNAATFVAVKQNITDRARTTPEVTWSPAPWTTVGITGIEQRTPNLAPLIQAVVNRPGWASGNALAFILTGAGQRVGVSFDGNAAPVLHLEYAVLPANSPNQYIYLPMITRE